MVAHRVNQVRPTIIPKGLGLIELGCLDTD